MDRGQELKDLMLKHFGSVAAFSRAAGLPATTVYNVISRGVEGASFETVVKIYDALQIDWSATGLDGPFKSKLDNQSSGDGIIKPSYSYHVVPIVGDVAAGDPCEAIELIDDVLTVPEAFRETHPDARALRIRGESMNKLFQADSYVIYDPDLEVRDGDVAVVYVNGDDATVKRVYFAGDTVVLHPESTMDEFLDRAINTKDPSSPSVAFAGRVIWATWGDKEVKF